VREEGLRAILILSTRRIAKGVWRGEGKTTLLGLRGLKIAAGVVLGEKA